MPELSKLLVTLTLYVALYLIQNYCTNFDIRPNVQKAPACSLVTQSVAQMCRNVQ